VPEVRVIGPDGSQLGILDIKQALRAAEDAGLDLVEIAPEAKPPVCKIIDYGKFIYAQEKKLKESRKKQHQTKVKEMRFGPQMAEHDYQFKLNLIKEFLAKRDKVKISMRFRGRQMNHIDLGQKLMERFVKDVSELATVEQHPRMEGRILQMLISPK
jgi:translation initiation factor IF-3